MLIMLLLNSAMAAEQYNDLDKIVAVVNDDIITRNELNQEVDILTERLSRQKAQLPAHNVFEKQVLERIILIRLQLQEADKSGIRIDDNILNDALRQLAAKNNMNLTRFRNTIESGGQDFAEFREDFRKELMIQQLRQRGVARKVTVSPREIQYFLENQARHGQQTLEYHLLHIRIDLPEGASVETTAAKKQKAEAMVKRLKAGEDFSAIAIAESDGAQALEGGDLGWLPLGKLPTLFANVVPQMTDHSIEGPLQSNSGFHIIKLAGKRGQKTSLITQYKVRHILIKPDEFLSDSDAEKKLGGLKQRIENKEDFSVLAKAHSQDTGSAADGGDVGWVNPGMMVEEFEQVMRQTPMNTTSAPFRTQFGWHILQVLEQRQHDNTEEAQQDEARKQIRERKMDSAFQDWLRRLRDEAYVEIRLD
jgi:peptidyl-prolyl cis-trans isomerase SurA